MNVQCDLSKYEGFTRQVPFDFAKNSSIGCGGKARAAFYPQSVEEMIALLCQLEQDGLEYVVLGNLTNVLPSEGYHSRLVISTKKLNGIVVGADVFVYAGATSGELLTVCKREKRTGAEFLLGIPCTLGGALYMNGGAAGKYLSEIVKSVLVLREGKKKLLSVEECAYAYKQSAFMKNNDVILGATLDLEESDDEEIERKRTYYLHRRAHLPTGKSMGCVFKNPEGYAAGALMEGSGLKGLRVGGAKISERHANFIINDRGATTGDIRTLIALAKNAVYAQYGVRLQEEIQYL